MDDIFCKIIRGEIASEEPVYRDDAVIVLKDIHPAAPVHLLVIPVKHIESIDAAGPEDTAILGTMMLVAKKVAADAGLKEGYRLIINTGEHGGQMVPHLHLHVLGGRHLGAKIIRD